MGIVNVKVGDLEVPMDLNLEHDVRSNIQYIAKELGFKPSDLVNRSYSGIATAPHLGLKFQLRIKGTVNPLPGGKSLKDLGIHEFKGIGGTPQPANGRVPAQNNTIPVPDSQTIEMYDPNDPTLQPPYPSDRFGSSYIVVQDFP